MIRYDPKSRAFAICLAALAGFVDAVGFLRTGGFFVSFMSGNSTRMAVGVENRSAAAPIAAVLILLFVVGVVLGSFVATAARARREPMVVSTVAGLLAIAAAAGSAGADKLAIAFLVCAMGAVNTVFQRDGEVSVGVTYMTGTLVKLGQRIADALQGGSRTAWLPYLLLWCGLVAGGMAGALGYRYAPAASLWVAALFALALVPVAARLARRAA